MNTFALLSLFCSLIFFTLGILIFLKNNKENLNRIFLFLCLSCTWWAFTEFGYRQADSFKEATFWLKLNGFWPFTVTLFLNFSLVLVEKNKFLKNRFSYLLIYLPALLFVSFNLYSGGILSETVMAPWGCWTYKLQNNIYIWIIQLWSYFVAVLPLFLFVRYYRQLKSDRKKKQIKFVLIALIFPVSTSIYEEFLLPYFGYSVPELTVPGMTIGFVFIGYAIWKHELFKITPASAAENILSVMSELVILTDEHGTIESINKATLQLTNYSENELIGKSISFLFFNREEKNEIFLKTIENGTYYEEQGWIRANPELLIPVSISAVAKYDSHKNINGVVFVGRDITERTISQQALQESEEKLRGVLSSLHETIIIVFDYDGNHLHYWTSPGLDERYGFSSSQFTGKNLKELFPEDEAIDKIRKIQSIYNSGKPLREEYSALLPNGQFWFDGSFSPMFNAAGKVTSVAAFVRDITEQKKSREELYKTKELIEKTFLGMDSAILILDNNIPPLIIDCNPAAFKIFGYTKEGILGKTTTFLHVNDESLKKFQQELYPAIDKNGVLTQLEFNMKRKDGTVFPTEHSIFPLKDNDGQRIGWVSVVKDITKRKYVEQLLRDSEEKYRSIFENVNDAIFYTDKFGKIMDVNDRVKDMVGYERQKFIGAHFSRLLTLKPKDIPQLIKQFSAMIMRKKTLNLVELELKHKNGKKVWVESSTRILKKENKLAGFISIIRDITERKKLQEELLQMEKVASLSTMLSGLAHNLNNPIFLASGRLDLLKNTGTLSKKQSDMVEVIEKQIERIVSLTKEMLELGYSKATEKKKIDLNEIVKIAVGNIKKFPIDKKIDIQSKLTCDLIFNANPVEINQIVTNLILNAIDAINKKGIVKVKTYSHDKCSIFEIQDDGKGMSEDTLKKVFDPLFTTKTGIAAKGMGMTIVQQFLQRNNGTIEIQSLKNRGTLVKVSFPESFKSS